MGVIKKIAGLTGFIGAGVLAIVHGKKEHDKRVKSEDYGKKINSYYHILNHWLKMKQEGVSCKNYFLENDYKRIAIYGFRELGERLYAELKGSEIEVAFIIDKNVDAVWAEIDVYSPDEDYPSTEVDAIVVTASYYYNEIEMELRKKVNCPIVTIEDVVL